MHPSGARLDHRALALVETTVDAHQNALQSDPKRLFAVLYNALYWHDAPEGDAHYASPPPRDDRQIWRWMEAWRREFEARPHARWLRRIRPPGPTPTALLGWRTAGGSPALSPNGALVLVTHANSLELLDARTALSLGQLPRPREYLGRGNNAHGGFSPTGDRVLTFSDKSATLWSVAPLATLRTYGPAKSAVSCAAFSRDGRVIFTGASYDAVRAWDAEDGSLVAELVTEGLSGLYACGDDSVVVATHDTWCLWSPRDGDVFTPKADSKQKALWSVALSPGGDRLFTRSNVALEGFELPDGKRLFRDACSSHNQVEDVHPGSGLFALLAVGVCELRDANTGDVRVRVPMGHVQRATFDPSGRFMIVCQHWRSTLWDLDANAPVAWAWQSVGTGEGSSSFSLDGKRLAIGNTDTLVLDLTTLAPAPAMPDDVPPPLACSPTSLSPNGSSVAAQTEGGLAFWDVASGKRLRVVPSKHYALRHGRHLLCYRDGELVALDPETGLDRFVLAVPGDPLEYPSANESATLLARTRSGLVVAFSLDDGSECYRLPSSDLLVLVAPDLFVIRNPNRTLGMRAVSTGRELLALPTAHEGCELRLSPDRRWLAVHGGSSSAVEVWELAPAGRRHVLHAGYDSLSFSFSADSASATLYSSAPTPQSGNSDPDDSIDTAALEPGEPFLPATDVASPRLPPPRLKDIAPELVWDRGVRSLADAVAYTLPSGLLVVDVTADQVELYRTEPASRT
ncbi:MAG: WD40 repeat domain-containing protein [Deltaproteobacteria bacterium]|nr:WD40 repeat domain-containing protein [Deltaproteobacteria bacterium]